MSPEKTQEIVKTLAGLRTNSERPCNMTNKLVTFLSSHEASMMPHDIDILTNICTIIDGIEDADQAWGCLNDVINSKEFKKPAERFVSLKALASNIHKSTVAYLNNETGEVASGVFVLICNRLFLATTAHSIPPYPKGKLTFIGRKSREISKSVPGIMQYAKANDEIDVAFLELDPRALGFLEKQAIGLDRIFPCGAGKKEMWTVVFGYPAKMVEERPNKELLFTPQSYGYTILQMKNWNILKQFQNVRKANKKCDIFIPYSKQEAVLDLLTNSDSELPEPQGMSGGGYWQIQVKNRKKFLWVPENYKLIGIQSTWWKGYQYLQGVRIEFWLKLIWENCDELRSELKSNFPKLFK